MKSFIVLALFVASAIAAPPSTSDGAAGIIRSENNNIGIDGYSYGYETTNGIKGSEEATLVGGGTENEGIEVRGQYEYTGPDGILYSVTYTAGREGFKPNGNHIPQAL